MFGNKCGKASRIQQERFQVFFGIHDARKDGVHRLSNPSFFKGKPCGDPIKRPLYTALSVLSKSAGALLVDRKLAVPPHYWNIVSVPYVGDLDQPEISSLFSGREPFDSNVRVRIDELEADIWFVLYAARTALVFFFFIFRDEMRVLGLIQEKFSNEQRFQFSGATLMQLVGYDWRIV